MCDDPFHNYSLTSLSLKDLCLGTGGYILGNVLQEKYDNIVNKTKPFIFKLTKYGAKKLFGTDFNSPSFYTSTDGYSMCIDVWPNGNGDGIGKHVSVFMRVVMTRT